MKRHVWVQRNYKLYPNQYIVLVGPPGAGKGASLNPITEVAKASGVINILSDRLTVPYIIERVSQGFAGPIQTGLGTGTIALDHSVFIFATELPVLLGNPTELKYLSDLWDSRETEYQYGTRGGGFLKIPVVNFNILSGVTPSGLRESIPPPAISGGFTRRIAFIFATGRAKDIHWPQQPPPMDDLVDDLRYISTNLRGEFSFEPMAKSLFESVYDSSKPGNTEDEFIAHFRTTRWVHAVKLAMVLSASRSDSMLISKVDMERATAEIDQVEEDLPKVFSRIGEGTIVDLSERILALLDKRGYATKSEIGHALWRYVVRDSEDLTKAILAFVEYGEILEVPLGNKIIYKRNPNPPKH